MAARLERQRQAGLLENENLFKPPSRMDNNYTSDVEKVMGKYNAANVAILNTPSYLGVDYAPPTPAPAKEHIIGEEDEVDTAEPVSRGHIRKPSQPPAPRQSSASSLRPPAIPPPVAKPSSSLKPPSSSRDNPMAPPHLPNKPSPKLNQSSGAKSDLQHPKKRSAEKLSPLILPSNSKKHGLSSQESIEDDRKLEDILKGAKQIRNFIPEPLSGIETPHLEVDWNTQKQKRNVYAMGMPPFNRDPFRVDDSKNSRSSSPQKKLSESSTEAAHASPMPSANKESSSSEQDSSSESDKSDSEVESDKEKEDAASMFALGSLMPIKSPQVVTPSPRQPTPSPYSAQAALSPAVASPPGLGVKAGVGFPLQSSPSFGAQLPALLSPMHSEDSDKESPVKVKQRPAPSRSDADSEDESRKSFKENKKPKSSNKRGRKSSVKSGSEQRHKSNALINDDSDSEPDPPAKLKSHHGRSQSSTPAKKPSSKRKPGSAQSTPSHRATSTHSSPSRARKRDPSMSSISSVSKSGKTAPVPIPRRSTVSLSEDDDFPIRSPEPVKKTKSAVLSSVFGGFKGVGGGKGGKGKDKRGKGGITVVEKEDSTLIENDKVPSITSPVVNNHHSSPYVNREKDKKTSWIDCIKQEKMDCNKREKNGYIKQENHKSLPNISKKEASGLSEDLSLSDDSIASPGDSRYKPFTQSSSLNNGPGQGTSLLVSFPLSKLSRSMDSLQSKFKNKNKKPILKQECWITSEDERGGSGRKRKSSQSPVKSESDHRQGLKRSSDKTAQHRKSNERTHLGEKESESVSESRKRRDRDQSPEKANDSESDLFSKRLRTLPSPPDSASLDVNDGSYFGPEPEPPPPDPSLVPAHAHPTWPGPGMMLPPPHPPKRVYFSYFERRQQENESFDDEEENVDVVDEAKRLKHEADQETNMNNRCRKYLQAIMMFSICGSRTEAMGDKMTAYSLYLQTLSIIKFVHKLTNSSRNNNQDVDTRLVVLSLRAQSLLNLKLYKMKRHELKDYQKAIQDVLANSEDEQASAEHGQNRTEQMSTPSPAGSEGSNASRSSDYYSSGENRLGGVLTPPTSGPVCLSIPRNVMQNQYKFCSYLSQCHELWEQADLFVAKGEGKGRGTCEEFFIRLDQECGPLTLHSSLKDLVTYTRRSLEAIEHSRGQSSAELMLGPAPVDSESFR